MMHHLALQRGLDSSYFMKEKYEQASTSNEQSMGEKSNKWIRSHQRKNAAIYEQNEETQFSKNSEGQGESSGGEQKAFEKQML